MVMLTQEFIDSLPVLTEEEEKELDSIDDNYALESFNEKCEIIDEIHYKYQGVLSHAQITEKINEEFAKRGMKCLLKL